MSPAPSSPGTDEVTLLPGGKLVFGHKKHLRGGRVQGGLGILMVLFSPSVGGPWVEPRPRRVLPCLQIPEGVYKFQRVIKTILTIFIYVVDIYCSTCCMPDAMAHVEGTEGHQLREPGPQGKLTRRCSIAVQHDGELPEEHRVPVSEEWGIPDCFSVDGVLSLNLEP